MKTSNWTDLGEWLKALTRHWIARIGGPLVAAFQILYGIWRRDWPPALGWAILAGCFVWATFLTWRDEHRKTIGKERRCILNEYVVAEKPLKYRLRRYLESLNPELLDAVDAGETPIGIWISNERLGELMRLAYEPGGVDLIELKEGVAKIKGNPRRYNQVRHENGMFFDLSVESRHWHMYGLNIKPALRSETP